MYPITMIKEDILYKLFASYPSTHDINSGLFIPLTNNLALQVGYLTFSDTNPPDTVIVISRLIGVKPHFQRNPVGSTGL